MHGIPFSAQGNTPSPVNAAEPSPIRSKHTIRSSQNDVIKTQESLIAGL